MKPTQFKQAATKGKKMMTLDEWLSRIRGVKRCYNMMLNHNNARFLSEEQVNFLREAHSNGAQVGASFYGLWSHYAIIVNGDLRLSEVPLFQGHSELMIAGSGSLTIEKQSAACPCPYNGRDYKLLRNFDGPIIVEGRDVIGWEYRIVKSEPRPILPDIDLTMD